jgi:hypothetical protein
MLVLFLAVGASLLVAGSALAANPEKLWETPELGSQENSYKAGSLDNPWPLATNSTNGHVFAAGTDSFRIDEFTSWGVFAKAWGWGVRDGSPELQTCTTATGCRQGIAGTGPGQFQGAIMGLAVDDSGSVYAYSRKSEGAQDFRVQKFTAQGEFVFALGREVDKTTHGNICTASSADVCGTGLSGAGPGEFSNGGLGQLLAVGPDGTIYVGDVGRVEEFEPDGAFKGQIELKGAIAGKGIRAIAVDTQGAIFVLTGEDPNVSKIDSNGFVVSELPATRPRALAADSEGDLYVLDRDIQIFPKYEVLEYDAGGNCIICPGDKFGAVDRPGAIDFGNINVNGIATNVLGDGSDTAGDIYLSHFNNDSGSYLTGYGPIPEFEPAPETVPQVNGQSADTVGAEAATVSAGVNPHFFATTTYRVEYGTSACALGGCQVTAPQPLGSRRNEFKRTAPVQLSGLQPGTTYHYRFVATSGALTSKGEGGGEVEATFTTRIAHPRVPPDGRAYEMVSPPEKQNGEAGGGSLSVAPNQAAPGGEAVTWTTFSAFGDAQSASGGSQYLSHRTSTGWVTENITPPDRESYLEPPVRAFSEDLSRAFMVVREPVLTEDAPLGFINLYQRDSSSGAISLITEAAPQVEPGGFYCVQYAGASDDFSRVFFTARGALTPDAPLGDGNSLYEWSAEEGLRLVDILPKSGKPAPASPFNGFGPAGFSCEIKPNAPKAISADGSVAYWTGNGDLFVRIGGSESQRLDNTQGGPGPAGGGVFLTASADGSHAYFRASGKLTAGAGNGALYRYDIEAPEKQRLTVLTPGPENANVGALLGASRDGKRLYFTSTAAYDAGAEAGKTNLYLWEEGEGLRFIVTNSSPEPNATATADGSALVFQSTAPLTGYDNIDQATGVRDPEVFLYDAETEELSCASCNPTNARPVGGSELPTTSTPFEQPHYISSDGKRVFFMSSDSIDGNDENGVKDVYEFERPGIGGCSTESPAYVQTEDGCVNLISSGQNPVRSVFVDASADGSDAFFATAQQLVGQDEDERFDIYDAHVGGGFPPPPAPPAACTGSEECHGSPPPPPGVIAPGSASFSGPGVTPPRRPKPKCKRGFVRKHGKCVKQHRKRSSKHRKPRSNGRAGR